MDFFRGIFILGVIGCKVVRPISGVYNVDHCRHSFLLSSSCNSLEVLKPFTEESVFCPPRQLEATQGSLPYSKKNSLKTKQGDENLTSHLVGVHSLCSITSFYFGTVVCFVLFFLCFAKRNLGFF